MKKELGTFEKIEKMVWSYSRVSAFETCPHGWYLQYIDKEDRKQNYFASYGKFHHKIFELFWNGELELWDIPTYYEDNFYEQVSLRPPSVLERWSTGQKNYDAGLEFYNNFNWNLSDWEVLGNEMKLNSVHEGINLTIRPDTLVKNKETSEIILIDYKSSKPFNKSGSPVKKKVAEYKKQLLLYSYFVEKEMNVKVDKFMLIFPKLSLDKNLVFDYNKVEGQEVVDWFMETIEKIKTEELFKANVTKKNKFFCDNICGVSKHCIWKV